MLDAAGIAGTGTANQPTGLLKTPGIGDVSIGISGGVPTAASVIALEESVGKGNSDDLSNAFLTTPQLRSKLRAVAEISGSRPLWINGTMLGYLESVSNQVPSNLSKGSNNDCHALIFGSWSQLVLADFNGALEVIVDPYSFKKQGQIEICSWNSYDVGVLAPAAFCAIQDARLQ